MSTEPPSRDEPQRHRHVAESFGTDAERYDRTRPHYPDAMVERIVAASPGPDFLDVGIGTGIEARQFRAAGCEVLGVEPDARMADFARRGRAVVALGGRDRGSGEGGTGAAARWSARGVLERGPAPASGGGSLRHSLS